MTYVAPEADDASDLVRRQRAVAASQRRLLDALYALGPRLNERDRGFVIRLRKSDLMQLSEGDRTRLDRVVWQQRRQLPEGLRPRLPAFDPIVREMEATGV